MGVENECDLQTSSGNVAIFTSCPIECNACDGDVNYELWLELSEPPADSGCRDSPRGLAGADGEIFMCSDVGAQRHFELLNSLREAPQKSNVCLQSDSIFRACQYSCDACIGEVNSARFVALSSFEEAKVDKLTGQEACEGLGLDEIECSNIGCCEWRDSTCFSSVGSNMCSSASVDIATDGPEPEATADQSIYSSEALTTSEKQRIEDELEYADPSVIEAAMKGNVVKLDLYFQSMWTETYNTSPSFGWASLAASLGGNLGLYVGFSIVTFVEFFEYFGVCILWYHNYYNDPQRGGKSKKVV
jgi:hypothetical protein